MSYSAYPAGSRQPYSTSALEISRPSESLSRKLRRWILGAAWSLKPPRTFGAPAALWMVFSHYAGLRETIVGVPSPEDALKRPDGLIGICTSMREELLMEGYRTGLFPFSHIGPQKWWAPSRRMVLKISNFHMEKNLRRRIRSGKYTVTFDRAFSDVIRACADPRQGKWQLTWITPQVIEAYERLHAAGHAHSVEVWDEDGNLAGGAYGVAAGQVFFTESQFSRQRDASKVGFAVLNRHLQEWGFVLNDGKFYTNHLEQAGFEMMPRNRFNKLLSTHCNAAGKEGLWLVDDALDVGNWDPSQGATI